MKRFPALLALLATALFADTAETGYFRGIMLPSNEVPAVTVAATGNATMIAHIVRNDAGKIVSGSVDFIVNHAFPGATTFTGLHIHSGSSTVAGPVTIGTDLSATNTLASATGVGTITKQAPATAQAALDTLDGMLTNPSLYYVNLHTTDNTGGAIRGQLQRAEVRVLMGIMSPANENPPIDSPAAGVSQVTVIATRNAAGVYTSGQFIFDLIYSGFNGAKQTNVTGFHIHTGVAGINGAVTINTGLNGTTAAVQTDATGGGTIRRTVEADITRPDQLDTLTGMFTHPRDYYINAHTTENGGGLIRDQLRTTDTIPFNVTMLPSNEVPAVVIDASAPAQVLIRTVRAEDGTVLAGTATFDVNYRFPAARVEFTGLHVHDGAAGVNGSVRLNSALSAANSIVSESGFGNIYLFATMSDVNAVATLNSLVQNPERHYVNLHTTVNAGGVIRAQLTPANTTLPAITGVTSAGGGSTVAPGGLVLIDGTNLSKITNTMDGWQGKTLPTSFDGIKVTIGGQNAPIIFVSAGRLTVQAPLEVTAGTQPVIVTTQNGASPAANVTVATNAPAVFTDPGNAGRGLVTHLDYSLVTPASPAKAGETILIWATGLGQTTPAMTTGTLVTYPPGSNAATTTVTIGGQNGTVVYSLASPGAVGLYQIAVTVPTGVTPGNASTVVRVGTTNASAVTIAVQ